jgi:catechol 2,3-dioxygenase-like lactoylglutathione lyase family enzyme
MNLDHTLIPANDKEESARFFARIMGLQFAGIHGTSGLVAVDDTLTLRFDERQTGRIHLAFHVTEAEFDSIVGRLQDESVPYGTTGSRSGAFNMQIGEHNGGKRVYFDDPAGQNVELMTVPTAGLG